MQMLNPFFQFRLKPDKAHLFSEFEFTRQPLKTAALWATADDKETELGENIPNITGGFQENINAFFLDEPANKTDNVGFSGISDTRFNTAPFFHINTVINNLYA